MAGAPRTPLDALKEQDAIMAANAERLLSDPAYKQAREDVRNRIVDEIRRLKPNDVAGLKMAKAKLEVLEQLDQVLAGRALRGRLAANPPGQDVEEGRLDV